MAEAYKYSSTAVETTLSGGIDGSDTTISVGATTGFPTAPFKLTLAPETGSEEIVKVTDVAGLSLTVTRGHDGTVAVGHSAGDGVRHQATGEDLRLSRQHEDAVADVHGVGATADVVGTTTVQTLEGKTIDGTDNTLVVAQADVAGLVTALADLVTADAAINTNIDDWDADAPATFSYTAAPSTYPSGFSIKKILASGGWPVDGFVITYKLADNTRALQFFGEAGTGSTSTAYFRHYNGTAWQAHKGLANPSLGSNWLTALAATLAGDWTNILDSPINGGWLNHFAKDPGRVYAQRTTDLALSTSYQDVVSLPAITGDGVTPWRVEISWWGVNPDGETNPLISFAIREGSTVIDEARGYLASNSTENGGSRAVIFIPSSASHTYKFSALSTLGTPILEATATRRAQINAQPWIGP